MLLSFAGWLCADAIVDVVFAVLVETHGGFAQAITCVRSAASEGAVVNDPHGGSSISKRRHC